MARGAVKSLRVDDPGQRRAHGAGHALQPLEQPRRGDAEQAEGDHAREDVLGVEELEGLPEEEAEPGLGRLDLGDEDEDERHARAEPQPGEDAGQRAGQDDLGEGLGRPAPRSWAALSSTGLMDFTPAMVLTSTRKSTPIAIVAILDGSPRPNQSRKSGKSADLGMG